MGFMELPLHDVVIPEILPEGTYDVRIVDATPAHKAEKERTDVLVRLEVLNMSEPVEAIFEHLIGHAPNDTEQAVQTKMRRIIGFCTAFGIQYMEDGIELEDFLGKEARIKIKQEEYDGRVSNKLVYKW